MRQDFNELFMKKFVLIIAIVHCVVNVFSQQKPLTENFLSNVGDTVVVTGKIYGGAFLVHVNTKPTFLNLGDTSPNHRLIIRIEPEDRDKFPAAPETYFLHKMVQVTGKLLDYKGLPLISISEPNMIKITPDVVDSTLREANFTTLGSVIQTNKAIAGQKEYAAPKLQALRPDTILQSAWIKSVIEKAEDDKKINLRRVQKNMDLRTAPFRNAPVIAQLHPGMLVSILYTSKKWSYISIGSVDGFNNVNGFIKHKRFKHLQKPDSK